MTGGYLKALDLTQDYVTEFSLTEDVKEIPLARMNKARFQHVCGVYQEADGQQVRKFAVYCCEVRDVCAYIFECCPKS